MNTRVTAPAILVASLGLGGCANNPIANTVSTLQVCAESARILTDIEKVLRMAMANPLAADTYAERLSELFEEFTALEPRDEELLAAHSALSLQIDEVVKIVSSPSPSAVTELPAVVAQSQIALMDYTRAFTP